MPQESTLINLVSEIDDDKQKEIAGEIIENTDTDISSRSDWAKKRDDWSKLNACQRDERFWHGSNTKRSSICLPILATAVNQFHARAYQSIFAAPGLVKAIPVGRMDVNRASNVEAALNWQVMYGIEDYEEIFDKTLQQLPINGIAFKKLGWDSEAKQAVASYLSPLDVILPYRTVSLKTARRIVHKIEMHYEELLDRNEQGLYENFDKISEDGLHDTLNEPNRDTDDEQVGMSSVKASEEPHIILECHKTYDIGPGRKPYIFTVHKASGALLRITSREYKEGSTAKVINHFIDYHFIPNAEGFYSFGFGHFLQQFNEIANTVLDQIVDAGTLTNMPFMFHTRRAGFRKNRIQLTPGAANEVEDASQIFFPQMQKMDNVLFNVLGVIQGWGDRFTSVTDPLTGRETPGVERPTFRGKALLIEQGSTQFTVMAKRVFRSLRKEFRLLMLLDQLFWPESAQVRIFEREGKIAFKETKKEDFQGVNDIIPTADPSFASQSIRRQEAAQLHEIFMASPTVVGNPEAGIPPNVDVMNKSLKRLEETFNTPTILPDLPEEQISPEDENALFMQGESKEPQQGENHREHLEVHRRFMTKQWYDEMPKDYKTALQDHIQKTGEMMVDEALAVEQLGGIPRAGQREGQGAPNAPLQPLLRKGQ